MDCTDVSPAVVTRRDFLGYSAGTVLCLSLGSLQLGCASASRRHGYPINPDVRTTLERTLAFAYPGTQPDNYAPQELKDVAGYAANGYGEWSYGPPLPLEFRFDLMPAGYDQALPTRNTRCARFFAISDVHVTDKETPNQLLYLQQSQPFWYGNTSIYSPVMLYSTQVLDAALQTVNALHRQDPMDFGLSLGDSINNAQYNELRWYIDVMDGKYIRPSSGAHAGEDHIDYQVPFLAVGLDKAIPWYQVVGNHEQFFIGSFPIDAMGTAVRAAYTADTVWATGNLAVTGFPALFDVRNFQDGPQYYMGVIDGSTPHGDIVAAGATTAAEFAAGAPRVVADPDRRPLVRTEWVQELFNTTTLPAGHGLNLVDANDPNWEEGFACYSFIPKAGVPLKVIVLDVTQSGADGSTDIHGHGFLDAKRWAWLQAQLDAGQAANQLMIIAAHIPIAVAAFGFSEMEWWADPQNAVTLPELVAKLQASTNLIAWLAGHRHLNAVKALVSQDPAAPEQGFWQVETSSLREYPQQFRTFEIWLNSDYTVSIVTVNVDPSVADYTPAATSRRYAIATQQIVRTDLQVNTSNDAHAVLSATLAVPVPSMDPTRPQDGTPDPTIRYADLAGAGLPYTASYNAELFKPLGPAMVAALQGLFP